MKILLLTFLFSSLSFAHVELEPGDEQHHAGGRHPAAIANSLEKDGSEFYQQNNCLKYQQFELNNESFFQSDKIGIMYHVP
jgi:hypothetical protein